MKQRSYPYGSMTNEEIILKFVKEKELDEILKENGMEESEYIDKDVSWKYLYAREHLPNEKRIPIDRVDDF